MQLTAYICVLCVVMCKCLWVVHCPQGLHTALGPELLDLLYDSMPLLEGDVMVRHACMYACKHASGPAPAKAC